MPISMTRAEYEAKYGKPPVVSSVPEPIKMTRAEYNAKYGTQPETSPGIFSGDTLKGNTSYLADTKTSNPVPNVVRTVGNIPSSAVSLARGVTAPFNPLDTENPLNIGSNIAKGAQAVGDIVKNRGIIKGAGDVASGAFDTAKKIFKAPGEFIVDQAGKLISDPAKYASDTATKVAKVGIEDPLFVPSLLYGGPEAVGTKEDLISKVAKPFTKEADTSLKNIKSTAFEAMANRSSNNYQNDLSEFFTGTKKGTKLVTQEQMQGKDTADFLTKKTLSS